jgi:hypothetical protein
MLFKKFLDTAEKKAIGKKLNNTTLRPAFSYKKIPSYFNSAKTTKTDFSNKLTQVNKVTTRISKYIYYNIFYQPLQFLLFPKHIELILK